MEIGELQREAEMFLSQSPLNVIDAHTALTAECEGLEIYGAPLLGSAPAADYMFEKIKNALGPHYRLPQLWMEGAAGVISVFLPYTERVRKSNAESTSYPSAQWLHGRIQGAAVIQALTSHLTAYIENAGGKALAPAQDARFFSVQTARYLNEYGQEAEYTSNWSERHTAFACGLGTFGLSRGIITQKGTAGRLSSLITDLELDITPRKYSDLYEYCIRCGACARRCPSGAITLNRGKAHRPCADFLDRVLEQNKPYYGCGKCQVDTPCEDRIPRS